MDNIIFFRELLKNWRQTGSVTPSSRFLTDKVLSRIDFDTARFIIELGPGTGPVTRKLLERMHPECKLVIVELNESFCEMLRKIPDPRLTVRNVSALELGNLLDGEMADYVISGLPIAVFDKEVTKRIFDEVKKKLKPNGTFVQFQYSLVSLKEIKYSFRDVKISFVPINIPPAFVYHTSQFARSKKPSPFDHVKAKKQKLLEQLSKSKIHGRIKRVAEKIR